MLQEQRSFIKTRAGARVCKRQLHAMKKALAAEQLKNEWLQNMTVTNLQGSTIHGDFVMNISSNPGKSLTNEYFCESPKNL